MQIDIGYIIGPIKNKNLLKLVAKERLVVLCAKDHGSKLYRDPPTLLADQALILGD